MRRVALFALLLTNLPGSPARAEPARPALAGRALHAAGGEALKSGLLRLRPALLQRARAAGDGADHVFVGRAGITAAGRVLADFVVKARFHAVDASLPDEVLALPPNASDAAPEAAPEVSLEAIVGAWSAASGEGVARFEAAAKALAAALPAPASAALSPALTQRAEAAFERALGALVAQLPARPRQEAVLEEPDHGYYLSPDVTWRDKPLGEASPEALTAARDAARAGTLAEHLAALLPRHPQYQALVAAAERYAGLCAAGEWKPLAVPKSMKDTAALSALQERLGREGFLAATGGPPSGAWDAATEAAVLEVRRLRQLSVKSAAFDKDLVRVLNVPCAERLATLILNVRRWRHSAWNGEPESVQVNLAGQLLRYFRDGALVMSQRTIVGSDRSFFSATLGRRFWKNATPVLHDSIATVIVNPEWNVPTRIAREEIEVEIQKDPTYVQKMRFKVRVGGDGATYYTQESGPGNALGRIKILFPNSESVYLHDTPGHQAFKLPVRALSHGCVRVDNALDFGAELVRADKVKQGQAFDVKEIKDYVACCKKTRVYELSQEIPVFLEYYTASVDEAGALWFHPDVYGYDAEALAPAPSAP